ncbi:uncharacterized protein TNCV_505551 [Trichonephila clavipes]|nr:uncharacterized protein TNCV_505551 [Trichonephila clavipes]
MVSDGTKFAVGDIEKLFDEVRRNTKAKNEKWAKYNQRRRDVRIKVNDWILLKTHPLSSAAQKVVAKFKPKFEGPYRVLEVKQNNLVVWKSEKRENKSRSGEKCELEKKGTGFKKDQGERHTGTASNRRSPPGSWSEPNRKDKKDRKETLTYKISFKYGSGGPERKKRFRTEETMMPSTSGYNLRSRGGAKVESRPANEKRTQQGGLVRSRRSREKQQYSPYAEEQRRSSSRNTRSRRGQQQHCQERTGGANSQKTQFIQVLLRDFNYKA